MLGSRARLGVLVSILIVACEVVPWSEVCLVRGRCLFVDKDVIPRYIVRELVSSSKESNVCLAVALSSLTG